MKNSNQNQTVIFLDDEGKANVFPVVKDRGLYRVLGAAVDMESKYPEPKYGLRLKPVALMKHEGRELALVICFSDDKGGEEGEIVLYFIDYREEDRDKAHEVIERSKPPSDLPEPPEVATMRILERLPTTSSE